MLFRIVSIRKVVRFDDYDALERVEMSSEEFGNHGRANRVVRWRSVVVKAVLSPSKKRSVIARFVDVLAVFFTDSISIQGEEN